MAKICICDVKAPKKIIDSLIKRGYEIVPSFNLNALNGGLKTHPDIQIFKIDDKRVIVEPNTLEHYKSHLSRYGIQVISGATILDNKYPSDIAYNIAMIGNSVIHNLKYTDKNISNLLEGKKRINIAQGYSKCSIVTLPNGFITSDVGIYKKIENEFKYSLLIENGHIELSGYDYGFLGGATGYDDKLYFAGSIENHPSYELIHRFLEGNGIDYVSLSDEKLVDIGTLMFLSDS
ncbi:MAG: hypothetical protein GXZ08_02390 [Tissierellia bacterium]|nr:hypothetical protein [Tissierellia bacterium]